MEGQGDNYATTSDIASLRTDMEQTQATLRRLEAFLTSQPGFATAAAATTATTAPTTPAAVVTPTFHGPMAPLSPNLEAARPRLPEAFDPSAKGYDVRRFVATLEIYFEAIGCSTPQHDAARIRLAATLLRGPALEWIYYTDVARGEKTWQQFRADLIERFEPINTTYMARQQIHRHKQYSRVAQYTQQMELLFNRITDLTEGEKIQAYTEGLKMEIQRQVIAANYNSYRDIVRAAERYDALTRAQQTPLLLEVLCNGRRLQALVDSGASHSVCDRGALEKIGEKAKETQFSATMVDGTKLPIHGETSLQLQKGALRWKSKLPVTKLKGLDFILGRDFLKRFNPEIDWINSKVCIYNNGKRIALRSWTDTGDVPETTLARFEKAVNESNTGYLALVMAAAEEEKPSSELPAAVKEVLEQYKDINPTTYLQAFLQHAPTSMRSWRNQVRNQSHVHHTD
ncbi:unnamed protein product [Closterium sp. NIES-53]